MAEKEEDIERLSKIKNVGRKRAELLYKKGINSAEDIVEMGLGGLAEIPTIGFRSAKNILAGAKEIVEDSGESDDDLKALEELEESLGEMEELAVEEEPAVEEIGELDEERASLEDEEESIDDEMESLMDEIEALEELEDLDEGDEIKETIKERLIESEEEDFDLDSEIESILPTLEEMDEEDMHPDMKTAREIDKWLEEKVGIEQHIGEESVCPICSGVVSIYEDICSICGVEFIPDQAKCGYCGAIIDSEMVECSECKRALVDEKTLCPLCNNVVYASESSCPSCGAEFYEDSVRCVDCKAKVPINSIICPECDTILREKIIEERVAEGGPMSVRSESTRVDVEKIQLEISPGYGPSESSSQLDRGRTRTTRVLYPFPAIVGQERMKRALVLNAINPDIGGVLIEGQRGTAKSVAVRGLAEILPPIEVVSKCRFSCDPRKPEEWCWECREKFGESTEIPVETRPVSVVDLPLNATEDRVVGTLDVEKILSEGVKSFEEGILADANRGILYVDEINLLDDYIVDVLLDAAAMGIVTVEREEISLTYPSDFIIVGSMNPEEGALRPQLLDRMALNVKVVGIPDPEDRVKIINRNDEFKKDPHAFRDRFEPEMDEMRERIIRAKEIMDDVSISNRLDSVIARISVDFEVDGHRADLIMKRTSRTNAAWEGRKEVNAEDIMLAAEMALPHRMKKGPLEEKEFNTARLKRLVKDYIR